MKAVDVEQVDAGIGKVCRCLLKGSTNQRGERAVSRVMIGLELFIHLVAVVTGVFIALPMIDTEAPRGEAVRVDGLQKGAVRVARMDSKLDKDARLQRADQPKGKRRVSEPRWKRYDARRVFELQTARRSRQQDIALPFACHFHQRRPSPIRDGPRHTVPEKSP